MTKSHMNLRMLLAVLLAGLALNASAYIDPGSGSVLIQGLIAAIAAIGVTAKLYWHRLVGFFRRSTEDTVPSSNIEAERETPSD